jgi:hypothetical protein
MTGLCGSCLALSVGFVIRTKGLSTDAKYHRPSCNDLSTAEIVALVWTLYVVWPSKKKTIPELIETFPEISKQYQASYPQIRLPSLLYIVWDKDKAVAHGNFRAAITKVAGKFQ